MGFTEKMLLIREVENELLEIVDSIKTDLGEAVDAQDFNGEIICDGRDGKPCCCTVRLSELKKCDNWLPSYYMPMKQAEAVRKRLEKCKTSTNLCAAIREMLREKRVRMSSAYGDYVYLNDKTLQILRDSEVGQYISLNDTTD